MQLHRMLLGASVAAVDDSLPSSSRRCLGWCSCQLCEAPAVHAGSIPFCAVDESLPNSGGEEEEAEAGALGHQKSGLSHMADYVMDDDDYVAATKTNRARQRVNVRRSAPGGGRGRGGRRRRDPDDDEAEENVGRKRRKRGEGLPRDAALACWGCGDGAATQRRHALVMAPNHEAHLAIGFEDAMLLQHVMGRWALQQLSCTAAWPCELPFCQWPFIPCFSMRQLSLVTSATASSP